MTGARVRAFAVIVVLITGTALAFAVLGRQREPLPARAAGDRPGLLVLTSLPLMFGDDFSLGSVGSPALKSLEGRYRIVPISVADRRELGKAHLLLMAHPAAQPAEDLVALDAWVRDGGHVLLLADPLLEWPSSRPLGDRLRPSPMFMDTGLLAHWGLRLDAPEQRGRQPRKLAGYDIMTDSPGSLAGACQIAADRLVGHCRIGRGRATIVADADLLDVQRLGAGHNLDAVLAELDALEGK